MCSKTEGGNIKESKLKLKVVFKSSASLEKFMFKAKIRSFKNFNALLTFLRFRLNLIRLLFQNSITDENATTFFACYGFSSDRIAERIEVLN